MGESLSSIVFLIFGLFAGAGIVIVIYVFRKRALTTKAADLISEAVKKAEEAKKTSLAEIKQESLRLKEETDKEIKDIRKKKKTF